VHVLRAVHVGAGGDVPELRRRAGRPGGVGVVAVDGWRCPACDRVFAKTRQSHDCSPGLSLEEYFSTGPAHERPVFDAVLAVLADVGPVHVDCVSVGLFLKNPEKFAELRPMQRWVAVSFWLRRRARHRTITRKVNEYGGRFWHTANVADPSDLDDALVSLLVEAYQSR
jgi:hypothetical protein